MSTPVRAFLSIDLDDSNIVTRLVALQKKLDRHAARMKLVEDNNIHITLRFFGNIPLSQVERIYEELRLIQFEPFVIRIGGVGAFPTVKRPNVIWVGVTENRERILKLKSEIDDHLGNLSYPPDRRFKAHATIARIRAVRNREQLAANLASLRHETIGSMVIQCFRLKKSTLTPKGPIYETLWEITAK